MTDKNNVTQDGVAINTSEGTANVNPELFREYLKQSYDALQQEDNAKAEFKDLVETVAETTKLPKKIVRKYLKARYKQATKAEKEVGDVFEQLDVAIDG